MMKRLEFGSGELGVGWCLQEGFMALRYELDVGRLRSL